MDALTINSNAILYISYAKNYVSVFYYADSNIKEHLLRSTLGNIEKQLSCDTIVRCHRSYIVNTNQVEKIQGNARNYFLKIPNIDFLIPVSRTYPKELLHCLVKKSR